MSFDNLDRQLSAFHWNTDAPAIPPADRPRVATLVHAEVAALPEVRMNQIRQQILIPPERYVEEMTAFQAWTSLSDALGRDPVVVRARVMTELYVSFVWLRDALMAPVAGATPANGTVAVVERFLKSGRRRLLRNAIAHGRWCYLAQFDGLEIWAEPSRGQPHQRHAIRESVRRGSRTRNNVV